MTDHHADIPSSSSSPDDKATLRARMKADLRAATPAFHAHASEAICESLIAFIAERIPARLGVMVYAPMPRAGEVDITAAIRQLLGDGRPILLPSLDWQARTMRPVRIRDWDADLIPDRLNERLGLRVPRDEVTASPPFPPIPLTHLGAVIVPGLAFDRTGARLGRGGGFYDRFFSSPPPPSLRTIPHPPRRRLPPPTPPRRRPADRAARHADGCPHHRAGDLPLLPAPRRHAIHVKPRSAHANRRAATASPLIPATTLCRSNPLVRCGAANRLRHR